MLLDAMSHRAALVVGVANKRSLAWSSALTLLRNSEFQHVIVTYQSDRFRSSIERLIQAENDALQRQFEFSEGYRQYMETYVSNKSDKIGNTITTNEQNELAYKIQTSPKRISCLECDVSVVESVKSLFTEGVPSLLQHGEKLETMIHSVAYAPADAMKPQVSDCEEWYSSLPTLNTTKEAFDIAHSVSSYSLLNLSRYALPLLSHKDVADGNGTEQSSRVSSSSSIITLSYLGATRAIPNYNIMGPAKASLESLTRYLALELSSPPHSIRVNAVSAGPIQTLAARGIKDFSALKQDSDEKNMLRRGISAEEVGQTVAFLADGRKSGGITGQVIFCDGGYSSCA